MNRILLVVIAVAITLISAPSNSAEKCKAEAQADGCWNFASDGRSTIFKRDPLPTGTDEGLGGAGG